MVDVAQKRNADMGLIIGRFDQILSKHIERLLGSRLAIGELPLNLTAVASLIFLAEQSANEKNGFSAVSERYDRQSLSQEMTEVGLEPDSFFHDVFEEMCQNNYVRVDAAGLISAEKSAVDVAQLIDRVFPGMPGLNLVAYIAQTIDETLSGRKDPDSALRQFDQTLMLQGVPVSKGISGFEKGQPRKRGAEQVIRARESASAYRNRPAGSASGNLISSLDFSGDYLEPGLSRNHVRQIRSRVLSSDDGIDRVEIKEISFAQALPEVSESDQACKSDEIQNESRRADGLTHPDEVAESAEHFCGETDKFGKSPETRDSGQDRKKDDFVAQQTGIETAADSSSLPQATEEPSAGSSNLESGQHEPQRIEENPDRKHAENICATRAADKFAIDDEAVIEKQIESFEEDLAMQCPICKIAKIISEKTTTGKIYYKCSSKWCHFISWGKPYHLTCPRCDNLFLVESRRKDQTVLKCPRATCRYRQTGMEVNPDQIQPVYGFVNPAVVPEIKTAKPRRRIVKRRLVRRKK